MSEKQPTNSEVDKSLERPEAIKPQGAVQHFNPYEISVSSQDPILGDLPAGVSHEEENDD